MLNNIANLEGVSVLDKKQQSEIKGSGGDEQTCSQLAYDTQVRLEEEGLPKELANLWADCNYINCMGGGVFPYF